MTAGVGVLTLPNLASNNFGLIGGQIALILGFLLTFIQFKFIFYCSSKNKIDNITDLATNLLPTFLSKIYKVTYFFDM